MKKIQIISSLTNNIYILKHISIVLMLIYFIGCDGILDNNKRPSDYSKISTLKKTGQTRVHENYDDGHYQIGVKLNYTRKNNIVTDNTTNLMWQDNRDIKNNEKNSSDAMSYCNVLTLGLHSDWRLPTIKELFYIVDIGKTNPSISDVFQNITSSYYWSSSSDASNLSYAWYVNFNNGHTYASSKTDSYYVRCVRGIQ